MKKLLYSILLMTAVLLTAQEQFKLDTEESVIEWKGAKVIGSSHTGTLKFKEGVIEMKNGQMTGGQFTVDMSTMNNTDLSGKMKSKLEGHLKSADFFGTEDYPMSTFVITKIAKDKGGMAKVTGELTIKDQTEEISFPAALRMESGWAVASAKLTFDRSKFDVRYGSGSFFDNLGDKAISDDIELNVKIKARNNQM